MTIMLQPQHCGGTARTAHGSPRRRVGDARLKSKTRNTAQHRVFAGIDRKPVARYRALLMSSRAFARRFSAHLQDECLESRFLPPLRGKVRKGGPGNGWRITAIAPILTFPRKGGRNCSPAQTQRARPDSILQACIGWLGLAAR